LIATNCFACQKESASNKDWEKTGKRKRHECGDEAKKKKKSSSLKYIVRSSRGKFHPHQIIHAEKSYKEGNKGGEIFSKLNKEAVALGVMLEGRNWLSSKVGHIQVLLSSMSCLMGVKWGPARGRESPGKCLILTRLGGGGRP